MIYVDDSKVDSLDIYIDGTLYLYHYMFLVEALKQNTIKGKLPVKLYLDSNGGSTNGLIDAMAYLNGYKFELHAYVYGSCCSACYMLASQCDSITASPSAIIGSVGVIFGVFSDDDEYTMRNKSIFCETNEEAKFKYAPSSDPEEMSKYVKENAEKTFLPIKKAMLENRKELKPETFSGKCFTAQDALSLNMIDNIKTFWEK